MIKEFSISSSKKEQILDISDQVAKIVAESKVKDGICLIFVPHATAAVMINENYDPNICDDILDALRKSVPEGGWRHDRVDGNATAHIKASWVGPSQVVLVKDGKLILGTWQSIMLADFDGPKKRRVVVQLIQS